MNITRSTPDNRKDGHMTRNNGRNLVEMVGEVFAERVRKETPMPIKVRTDTPHSFPVTFGMIWEIERNRNRDRNRDRV